MIRRSFLQALGLLALAALPAGVSGLVQLHATPPEPLAPGEVRPATARQWGDAVLYVDARSAERFEAGHIPGAVRLTQEEWETLWPRFVDAWDTKKAIVTYCDGGSCDTAQELAERLRSEMEVQTVFVLKGGWPAWQRK